MDNASPLWLLTMSVRPTEQRANKTARNPQSAKKSVSRPRPPSYAPDIDDINNPFQDNDALLDVPADEYLTDISENEEEEVLEHAEPSQTLLDALERLSLSVVQLHKMRRLPFLRRNLRRGFQLHCRMVGIDTDPHPLPRQSIPIVYTFPLVDGASSESGGIRTTTAKSSMKDWLCPLCDLHKKFDNPGVLDKHLAQDHSSVKVLWDDVRLLYSCEAFILYVISVIPCSP